MKVNLEEEKNGKEGNESYKIGEERIGKEFEDKGMGNKEGNVHGTLKCGIVVVHGTTLEHKDVKQEEDDVAIWAKVLLEKNTARG